MLATVLGYAADALSILALSIMAAASRAAWNRLGPETRVPVVAGLRAPRGAALALLPAVALAVGLALLAMKPEARSTTAAVTLFGARATLSALFALLHLRWLEGALRRLDAEGALKP